jgi:hypothetical protein
MKGLTDERYGGKAPFLPAPRGRPHLEHPPRQAKDPEVPVRPQAVVLLNQGRVQA